MSGTTTHGAGNLARLFAEALAGGGARATQFRRGMLGDYHYLQTVEPIKQLKRDGRLEEALVLCYGAIQASWRPTRLALCVGPDRLDTTGCRAASFRRL